MNIWKVNFANYCEGAISCTIRTYNSDLNSSLIKAQGIGCMLLISKTMMPIPPLDVYPLTWQTWLQSPWKYRWLSLHSSYTNFWASFHLWLIVVFRVLLDNCLLLNFVWKKKKTGAWKDGVKWEREVKKIFKLRLLLGSILALCLHPSVPPAAATAEINMYTGDGVDQAWHVSSAEFWQRTLISKHKGSFSGS